jgi:hypothetical protein
MWGVERASRGPPRVCASPFHRPPWRAKGAPPTKAPSGRPTQPAIAEPLFISERTVKSQAGNILRKPRLYDRAQAAVFALRNGLVK